jgi:hypothetical protein
VAYRESWTEGAFLLDQSAHLPLTVHRSARRELAALLESHDCFDNGTETVDVVMLVKDVLVDEAFERH